MSRVGAKSLDHVSRSTAFQLYGIVGQIRQEQDSVNKSDGYNFRFSKFKKFMAALIQRSAQNKFLSGQLLLGDTLGYDFQSVSTPFRNFQHGDQHPVPRFFWGFQIVGIPKLILGHLDYYRFK